MVGKATLFVVAGFSLIFLVVEYNMGNVSTRAVENFTEYYLENYSREIAASGANMAANKIFRDPTWTAGFSNMDFKEGKNEGKLNVRVDIIDAFKNHRRITSVGEYQGRKNTVEVTLAPSKFSKYAYYSTSEGGNIIWMSKDTVWGPFHTQDWLRVDGTPVFYGKVTTLNGLQKKNQSDKPKFLGGFESGINVPIPTNGVTSMESAAGSGGYKFTGKDTVYLTFVSDSIKVRYTYKGATTTFAANSFTSNGVIFAQNATVRIQGKVKGKFTVAVSGTSSKGGDIYIDDDITYNSNPLTNPNSTDILGLVAKNDVILTQNAANNNNVNIHASIFCETGSFTAENYNKRPVSGAINLLGGIIQYTRGAVGTFSGSTIKSGFSKSYKYDERLLLVSPPAFPGTGDYEIVSWYE